MRTLPLLSGSPLDGHGHDPAEDARVWTSTWVCVGLTDQIPAAGDLLPATVGDYGLHVQRQADGGLRAAFNVLQHGSCWTIPAQCRGGHKTACPYVSCGYSLDTDAIPADGGRPSREMRQFVGFNPAKAAPVPVDTVGPFVFVHLGADDPSRAVRRVDVPDDVRERLPRLGYRGRSWVELAANWRVATHTLAGALSTAPRTARVDARLVGRDIRVHHVFPTLAVIAAPGYLTAVVVKPTSPGSCRMLLGFYAEGAAGDLPPRASRKVIDAWAQICAHAVGPRGVGPRGSVRSG